MCGLAAPVAAQVPAKPDILGTQGTGDGKFTLLWRNPSDVSITGYQYQHKIGSTSSWGSTWNNIPGSGPTTTSYEFTGLANFLNHYVKIRAVNANGQSDASNERFGSPTGQLPAPTGLAATAGDEEVVLRWTMPSGAWDSHVFSYQYQMKEGSAGSWGSWTESSRYPNLSTTHTVTGLTNGTTYYFKVRATDGITLGQASGEASATPAAAQRPATPLAPTLAVGDRQLTVTWIPPAANRAAITDYDVRYKISSDTSWTDASYDGTGTSTTITGLTNGTSYQVQVLAKNRVGSSGWSPFASAIPVAVPATPVAPTLIPGDGQIQVSWNAPDNNGAAINDYDVRYKRSSDTVWTNHHHSGTTANTTIASIANGEAYYVQVRAKNWPQALAVGDRQLTVTWIPPAANRAAITDYDVQYRAGNSGSWTDHYSLRHWLDLGYHRPHQWPEPPGAGAGKEQPRLVGVVIHRNRNAGSGAGGLDRTVDAYGSRCGGGRRRGCAVVERFNARLG